MYNIAPVKRRSIWLPTAIGIAAGLALVSWLIWGQPAPPIPSQIHRQLTSNLLLPQASEYHVESSTAKYSTSLKLLSYKVQLPGGRHVTVSEQPSPDQFTDVPKAYDTFVNQAGEYASFESTIGTVYLAKPGGQQAAIMNTKGTLLFAQPDKPLSEDQWRQFFLSVEISK